MQRLSTRCLHTARVLRHNSLPASAAESATSTRAGIDWPGVLTEAAIFAALGVVVVGPAYYVRWEVDALRADLTSRLNTLEADMSANKAIAERINRPAKDRTTRVA